MSKKKDNWVNEKNSSSVRASRFFLAEIFINLFVYLLFSDGEVDSNPAQYREIQVNQLSEASEAGGFLPPIQTTGMYSMVH